MKPKPRRPRSQTVLRARERLIIVTALIDIFSVTMRAGQSSIARPDLVHLQAAVWYGHLGGKSMNASQLAKFVGVPRTTVIDRLRELIESGYVQRQGTRYIVPPDRFHLSRKRSVLHRIKKIILQAARDLNRKT